MEQDKIKDKALYFAGILSMCVLLVSVAYFFFLRTIQIDLQKNVSLHYTGENGMASLEVEIKGEDLNQRVQEFLDTLNQRGMLETNGCQESIDRQNTEN